MVQHKRLIYIILTILVMILGLASRSMSSYLPVFIGKYAGDTLWALMIFFGLRLIFIKRKALEVGLFSLIFSYTIEVSQLIQNDFLSLIRNTRIGGLILGYGFLWSDLICYLIGISIGVFIDCKILKKYK